MALNFSFNFFIKIAFNTSLKNYKSKLNILIILFLLISLELINSSLKLKSISLISNFSISK